MCAFRPGLAENRNISKMPKPRTPAQDRSVFSRFAIPYAFRPDLSPTEALLAIGAQLIRIFGACVLFAAWGGVSALVWNAIGNRLLRVAAELPVLLLFLGGLARAMAAISAVERWLLPDSEIRPAVSPGEGFQKKH